jgi:hypothetical protein
VAVINPYQVRITEACLYSAKELPRRIGDLQAHIDSIMPPLPGSVLKLAGRPVAKTPVDTSQTERWGIRRACCPEAEELAVKCHLYEKISEFISELRGRELEFVKLAYYMEFPPRKVSREMGMSERNYYLVRGKVLYRAWQHLKGIDDMLEVAVR